VLVSDHRVVGNNTQYHLARLLRIRRLGVRVPPSALHQCRSEVLFGVALVLLRPGVAQTWQEFAPQGRSAAGTPQGRRRGSQRNEFVPRRGNPRRHASRKTTPVRCHWRCPCLFAPLGRPPYRSTISPGQGLAQATPPRPARGGRRRACHRYVKCSDDTRVTRRAPGGGRSFPGCGGRPVRRRRRVPVRGDTPTGWG